MDPYQLLRKAATDRRNDVIEQAQAEYKRTLHQIAELRKRLPASPAEPRNYPPRRTGQTLVDLVHRVVPDDKPFTIRDMMKWLCKADRTGNSTSRVCGPP